MNAWQNDQYKSFQGELDSQLKDKTDLLNALNLIVYNPKKDGVNFHHAEISEGYLRDGTKHGTGHCTPEEVNRILDYYKDENPDTFRVERLGIYRPRT